MDNGQLIDIHTHGMRVVPGTALVCIGCGPIPAGAIEQGYLFSAGLHPWDVTGHDDEPFRNLEQLLSLPQVLAVGECGFDTLRGPAHELQEKAFVKQFCLSEKFQKPMILHVVRDFDSVFRLHRELKPSMQWLIHGFRGGPEQMNQLLSNGIFVSFGPKHNAQSLQQVPSEHLFLETDSNCTIQEVIDQAALVRGELPESIKTHIIRNLHSFLLH